MSLDKTNIDDMLALTPMQEGMLYLYLKDPQGADYIETFSMELEGELDVRSLERAWNAVILANEALRTCFVWKRVKRPVQVILKESEPVFRAIEDRAHESRLPFDLAKVPVEMEILQFHDRSHRLSIRYHHIVCDGWSLGILLRELFTAYLALREGKAPSLARKTRVREYIKFLQHQDPEAHLEFWQRELESFEGADSLASVVISPSSKGVSAASIASIAVPTEVKRGIEALARDCHTTPAAVFYCAWGLLLQQYCGAGDVIFGVTVSGRPPAVSGISDMVGLFINTLPLRLRLARGDRQTVRDLVTATGEHLREREVHDTSSLAEILSRVRGAAGEELFDTVVVVENYPLDPVFPLLKQCGLSASSAVMAEKTHYSVTLGVTLRDEIELDLLYDDESFDNRMMNGMARHLANLLAHMSRVPESVLSGLDILSPDERMLLIQTFNETTIDYPRHETIYTIFDRMACEKPDAAAVVCADRLLTYRELKLQTERLAVQLKERGVEEGSIVAVLAERSLQLAIAIIGILKAGCAYTPLEPTLPSQRVETTISDCACRVVVLDGEHRSLPEGPVARVMIPCDGYGDVEDEALDESFEADALDPEAVAYVIFTSGTTGKPKGVPVPHRAVVNRMYWVRDRYRLDARDVVLQATSFIFDVSVCELFRWILPGARLCFLPPGGESDPALIISVINRFHITTIDFVPSMVGYILDRLELRNLPGDAASLRWVFTGVEKVGTGVVKRFNALLHRSVGARLINAYGPTESTVDITCFDCCAIEDDFEGTVPIGAPMANVQIYIFDRYRRLQPVGVAGELCVGGRGLALGYLNRPELTAQSFTPLYHTGDLAYRHPDGTIQFIGRKDRQVKIRGRRVELEEIEQAILARPGVLEAAVAALDAEGGDSVLCGYIAVKNPHTFIVEELLDELRRRLPGYMVPAHLTALPALPRTPAGKVDQRALPVPNVLVRPQAAGEPPRTRLQGMLTSIWEEVLGLEQGSIGIDENFFDLGGHSLRATALAGCVFRDLQAELPVTAVFQHPTIRELASFIEARVGGGEDRIVPSEKMEYYPLSPAQKRLFILQQMEETRTSYNMFQAVVLRGEVDIGRLEAVFRRLLTRHDGLRTSFVIKDRQPVQRVRPLKELDFEINRFQLEGRPPERIIEDFIRPFDLALPPPIRVGLVELGEKELLLMLDIHHIVCDARSIELFVGEFATLYRGEELACPSLQYTDYALREARTQKSGGWRSQAEYWLERFKGEIPLLNLPLDYERPSRQSFAYDRVQSTLSAEATVAAWKLCREAGRPITMYMLLLAVYAAVLGKYCGQEDIVVGSGVAGRNHPDTAPLMGMFINMLALRCRPRENLAFKDYLLQVRQTVLEAFDHQDYPFDELVKELKLQREYGRNPLFDAEFTFQEEEALDLDVPQLAIEPFAYQHQLMKFDLSLTAFESDGSLRLIFGFCPELFKRATIEGFDRNFKEILAQATGNPEVSIAELAVTHNLTGGESAFGEEDYMDFNF